YTAKRDAFAREAHRVGRRRRRRGKRRRQDQQRNQRPPRPHRRRSYIRRTRSPHFADFLAAGPVARSPSCIVGCLGMGEPMVQLGAIEDSTAEMRGIAERALGWVRESEERLAVAETKLAENGTRAKEESAELRQRAEEESAELRQRAKATLQK